MVKTKRTRMLTHLLLDCLGSCLDGTSRPSVDKLSLSGREIKEHLRLRTAKVLIRMQKKKSNHRPISAQILGRVRANNLTFRTDCLYSTVLGPENLHTNPMFPLKQWHELLKFDMRVLGVKCGVHLKENRGLYRLDQIHT